jgi:Transposase/Transposase IS116/IS110/IS902 family
MPAKYVRPYSKGQKNDYRDAEAIAEAVQRPTMKFVATKTADQLDLQALHLVRERLVSQRTSIINQIRAFLLERGIAVRQGLRFLRAELPGILATRTDVLSSRMVRILEDLTADWRRLDARIEDLSGEIETLVRQDQHCERLMTVPGIGPIISSAMVAAIGTGDVFAKGRDFGAWLGLVRSKSRQETGRSLAAYRGTAIAICAPCSFRRPGSCWSSSGQSIGNAMGSNLGLTRRRSAYTTTCSPLRSPTSSPASRGRSSTRHAPSRATRPMRWRPVQRDPRCRARSRQGVAWQHGSERQGPRDDQP